MMEDPVEVIRRYVTEAYGVKVQKRHSSVQTVVDQQTHPHDDRNCVSVVLAPTRLLRQLMDYTQKARPQQSGRLLYPHVYRKFIDQV